jgi:hypothetical protein
MFLVSPSSKDYASFWQILTSYRQSKIFGIFENYNIANYIVSLSEKERTAFNICNYIGWEANAGKRMLDCFCKLGLLENNDSWYSLTGFSAYFFLKTSPHNQSTSIVFENLLEQSWDTLDDVLISGKRVFNIADKSKRDVEQMQKLLIGAMDEAAASRTQELWEGFEFEEKGTIADFGAGSGAYLTYFLSKFNKWNAIFCDLEDVVDIAKNNIKLQTMRERISFYECNLLDENLHLSRTLFSNIDIILFSNFIHCYNEEQLRMILNKILHATNVKATIIIHDFFKDLNWESALYDIHMMLNTYTGKVYSTDEIVTILKEYGFHEFKFKEYPSKSASIVATR